MVSRGGNFVIRATIGADFKLTTLDANNVARRFQTGNLPSGVVMSRDGKRAYTNNELNTSVSALNLEDNTRASRATSNRARRRRPARSSIDDLVGKLAFFTALGLPDKLDNNGDGAFDIALRDIDPLGSRGKASNNAWSGCASCHDDGHSDNVTWIFETGPRQTIPLEGTFARNELTDQRILNWSGVRGSNTDFNNNARGIQGGVGFATSVDGVDKTAQVFNHGPTQGISDSLDAMSEWVATVRAPIMPAIPAAANTRGRELFATSCASCHGGRKWTKSRTAGLYADNPLLQVDPVGPAFFTGVGINDAGVTMAGPQVVSVHAAAHRRPRSSRQRRHLQRGEPDRDSWRGRGGRADDAGLRAIRRARFQYALAAGCRVLGAVFARRVRGLTGRGRGTPHAAVRRHHRDPHDRAGSLGPLDVRAQHRRSDAALRVAGRRVHPVVRDRTGKCTDARNPPSCDSASETAAPCDSATARTIARPRPLPDWV